ncbi:hypothetical protein IQ254_07725 [Nodosilinea sp. LEGE 07088]|uniref:hypothetical protein n=1 Tax=Nodosilinea sp. LEGE 07088 TaxID=2777968 RepID=UPI00187FC51F|nr:hypothetical protein [Nodosilinea sp. LEGE 07088]MBE9137091.1 hypothetical protein [Nodosilinea sp. LEGE 07088]
MFYDSFTRQHRATGKAAAWGVCNIGILGYCGVASIAFLLLGIVFDRHQSASGD